MASRKRKVYLYRHFNAAGALLYVGVTFNPLRRDRDHASFSKWYNLVASTTLEVHPSREAGADAEENAIAKERPLFNIKISDRRKESGTQETLVMSFRVTLIEAEALDRAARKLHISRSEMLKRLLRNL